MSLRQSASTLLLTGALALAAAAQTPTAENVKTIAARVDAKYNRLQTLTADFTEHYTGSGVSRQETGTLALKRSGKMRWDFVQPRAKLFVSDGKTAYFYVPDDRQVRKAEVKKLDDFHSPIRYLLGKSQLQKEFQDLRLEAPSAYSQPGNVLISGVPKHLSERIDRVLFEITPASTIARIVIQEVDGATTEFRFANLTENAAIPDERFRFQVPKGVEVIDAKDLTGP